MANTEQSKERNEQRSDSSRRPRPTSAPERAPFEGGASGANATGTTTMDDVATDRGWAPSDQETSSPPSIATGSSTFSGTAYKDQAASPSTFTRENLGGPTSSPEAAMPSGIIAAPTPAGTPGTSNESRGEPRGIGNLSSIPGGRAREAQPAREGWLGTARDLKERAQDAAQNISAKAQDLANRAQDTASDLAKRAQDAAGSAVDNVSTTVRRHPVQSLLVGFGVGCLIGMIIPRRS